jgi:hypothetical protein
MNPTYDRPFNPAGMGAIYFDALNNPGASSQPSPSKGLPNILEKEPQAIETGRSAEGDVLVSISDQLIPQGIEVKDLLATIEKNPMNKKGAVYVTVPETVFNRFLPQLLQLNFKFHRYEEQPGKVPCFVYYKWLNPHKPDDVPPQATSLDHFAALVLSRDSQSVLMARENDKWKFITGPVTKQSGTLTGMETYLLKLGIELDPSCRPSYVGGWINERARGGNIHDRMDCFAVKAAMDIITRVANSELQLQWMPITILKTAATQMATNGAPALPNAADSDAFLCNGEAFNKYHLGWFLCYMQKAALPIQHTVSPTTGNLLFVLGGI